MNKFFRRVLPAALVSLTLVTAPTALAQSSVVDLPHVASLSSDVTFKNPFEPAVEPPSNQGGYGLRGSIEVYLAAQGYSVDRGGAVESQALELAKQGFNGEIRLDSRGISQPIYFPHGEGIVSRVRREDLAATGHWYLTATPLKVHNPKRAGVETWSVPGGDVYVGQFFTYD